MTNKHTPGPWHVGREYGAEQLRPEIQILRDVVFVEGGSTTTYVIGSVGYPTTCGNTVGASERVANARLIAAAPELLEALKKRTENEEQRVFEDWLSRERPSGDHDEVNRQWLSSSDYIDFCNEWRAELDAIDKATQGAA